MWSSLADATPARGPLACLLLSALILLPAVVSAERASELVVVHRHGQSFITWRDVGPGWKYRVYRDERPLASPPDIARALELGVVRDSSAVDRRRTRLLGTLQTFRIDSAGAPRPAASGLFVHAPAAPAMAHYAVLAESAGVIADSSLVGGENRTLAPVAEWPEAPLPVWQRSTSLPANGADYVLWVQSSPTPSFPALANQPNSATHLSVLRGIPGRPLTLFGHARGGNSYQALLGSGYPGESILSVEDHLPTEDQGGFTYGYAAKYDPSVYTNPVVPSGQIVEDYVERRILYALDWAERALGHDPRRVFVYGGSMGGSLAFFLAFHHPDRIAGSLGVVPKLCAGYLPDSYLSLRSSFNRLWGRLEDAPMGSNGVPVYQWMDGRALAARQRAVGAAPYWLFFGRADSVVGWPEKVAYAQAMQEHRIGGALFWDARAHYDPPEVVPWRPTQTARRTHGSRTDRSFPALSGCSADGDMGDGTPATGDSMGTINGHVEWDTTLVDLPGEWQCVLRSVSLPHRFGVFPAPESLTVDVTPRRLQHFLVSPGSHHVYQVEDLGSGLVVQSGDVHADAAALLTVPQVRVTRAGARLRIGDPVTGVAASTARIEQPRIVVGSQPMRGLSTLTVHWVDETRARLRLLDAAGRVLRTLQDGRVPRVQSLTLTSQGLAAGIYWIEASQRGQRASRRIAILH